MKRLEDSVVEEMVRRLVEAVQPVEIYLFGSQALGTADRDSDVDLLVVVADGGRAPRELARLGRKSLWGMGMPVDLVVCTTAEKAKWSRVGCNVIHTAMEKGRRVYAAAG